MIAADLGWNRSLVFGGFSAALVMMSLVSSTTGRFIDRHGGLAVMSVGSCFLALGCVGLSLARDVVTYYAAWLVLGCAIRATLYDAAFASLARVGGPQARRPISQITLLGGLASTTFWPIGDTLASLFGWRAAVLAYAGFAVITIPLHLAIPNARHKAAKTVPSTAPVRAREDRGRGRFLAALLYAGTAALANVLNSGMSAHMIPILAGLGLAASAAVWIATLRGIGQSAARLCEILFAKRLDPFDLNLGACLALPVSFIAGLWSGTSIVAAVVFALVYGAGNGLLTITRGTLPLLLFEPREYGTVVGRLIAPSFLLSAAAPLAFASLIEGFGERSALELSLGLSLGLFGCALLLRLRFKPRRD